MCSTIRLSFIQFASIKISKHPSVLSRILFSSTQHRHPTRVPPSTHQRNRTNPHRPPTGTRQDLDDHVNMRGISPPTTSKHARILLHPPKREESLSMEEIRPTRLRLSQPKREKSVSVEEIEEEVGEISVQGEAFRPIRSRLSQPRAKKVGEVLHRVRNGRILKASAKARK